MCLKLIRAYVPTRLKLLRAYMPTCLKLICAYVPTCPYFSRAYVRIYIYFFMPTCLRALNHFVPTWKNTWYKDSHKDIKYYIENICHQLSRFIYVLKFSMNLKYRSSHRCFSLNKTFLKTSQNSQENTCARIYFLIKLQISHLFYGTPPSDCFCIWPFIPFKNPKQTPASKTAYLNLILWGFVISAGASTETIIWRLIKKLSQTITLFNILNS